MRLPARLAASSASSTRLWATSSVTIRKKSSGSPIAKRSTSTGGWIDRRVPSVVGADPLAGQLRVGDVVSDPAEAAAVPARMRSSGRTQRRAQRARGFRRARARARARRSETASGSSRRARHPAAAARRGRRRCCWRRPRRAPRPAVARPRAGTGAADGESPAGRTRSALQVGGTDVVGREPAFGAALVVQERVDRRVRASTPRSPQRCARPRASRAGSRAPARRTSLAHR